MGDISKILIERYKRDRREVNSRRGKPMSPASVNREIELLSKVFSYAIEQGLVGTNPCNKVKRLDEDNARNRYLTANEEFRLLESLSGRRGHLRPIVLLAIHTVMRKSELLSLRWSNVDFGRGIIHVMNSQREKTKGKRSRSVPMNSVAREALLSLARNQYQIAAILGPADIKTSQIYTQATDEGLRRLMKALENGTDTVFPTTMDQRPEPAAVSA